MYSESVGDGRGGRISNAEGNKKSHQKEYALSRDHSLFNFERFNIF